MGALITLHYTDEHLPPRWILNGPMKLRYSDGRLPSQWPLVARMPALMTVRYTGCFSWLFRGVSWLFVVLRGVSWCFVEFRGDSW